MAKAIASEEALPKVMEVLNLIVTAMEKPSNKSKGKVMFDAYSYRAAEMSEYSNVHTVGKKCVDLVNQSICSQRYEQAAKLLCILSQDSTVYENFFFKAAMIILENLQYFDKDEVIYKFLKEVQNLAFVNKKETVLEYIQCGIRNDFSNLSSKLKGFNFVKKLRKHATIDPLFEAYCAYVDYITQFHANEVFSDCEMQASQASQISIEGLITKFKSLIRIPGDWDIFVLKLVEMLETNGRVEEVQEILYDYAKCNLHHLNGHIYLCEYLRKHDPNSEILIDHLKIIAELCPSDERVLLLIEKLNGYDELYKCLELIFMFLDYPSNGRNIKAWKILSHLLELAESKVSKEELITNYWNSRSSSWHWIYFNPSKVCSLNQDFFLVSIKCSVLSYFEEDHQYIKEAQRKYPECQIPK